MSCNNPSFEHSIQQRPDAINPGLAGFAGFEMSAAGHGCFASRGEPDPERTRRIAETDRLLNRLSAIGGGLLARPQT